MKSGSIIIHPTRNELGIVSHYAPHALGHGVRVALESGLIDTIYTELAEVTEFTPEITKRLVNFIPTRPFAASDKSYGLTGTDPEIFGFDPSGNVIPAWLWLADKKTNPDYYYDGVQAEFVTAPSTCHNYQTDYIRNKLLQVDKALKSHNPKAYLATRDVVKLDRKLLLSADDKYIELGCSPSGNAYPEVKPIDIGDPREHPWRYSGCHLHMSVLDYALPEWFPHGTVVMMDKIVGVMLTALGRGLEDPKRREAYGRAGEFRVPPPAPANRPGWGEYFKDKVWSRLEYRTPGSFLLHHPALFNFAMDVARVAFRMGLLMDGRKLDEIGDVQGIINNCDADAANKLIQASGSYYRKVLNNVSPSYYTSGKTLSILSQGAKASGRFGDSLYTNWNLGGFWNNDNYNNGSTKWTHFGDGQ